MFLCYFLEEIEFLKTTLYTRGQLHSQRGVWGIYDCLWNGYCTYWDCLRYCAWQTVASDRASYRRQLREVMVHN